MAPNLSFNLRRPQRDVVGLDIEPGYIVAAEASVNGSVAVRRAAGAELELDVVRDGEVLDAAALADALRNLFGEAHLSRTVRLGVANQRTVLRTLLLPPIADRKELAAAVRFQAQDEVPMPLNNAVLDFQPLGLVDTPDGPRQRVVLVAAQRDMIERLLSAVRDAGLRPVGVDLAAFAMIRSLYRPSDQGRLVYLGIGGLTNMAVADGSSCRFTRVLGGGVEAMASDLAVRREIPLGEARDLLRRVGVEEPAAALPETAPAPSSGPAFDPALGFAPDDEDVPPPAAASSGPAFDPAAGFASDEDVSQPPATAQRRVASSEPRLEARPDPDADVRRVLAAGVREIAAEVRNSLDYFQQASDAGEGVAGVILSGPGLEVPGFASALERDLGLPVHPRHVDGAGALNGSPVAQRVAVATGLAIEEPVG